MAHKKPAPFTLAQVNGYERQKANTGMLAQLRAISPDVVAAMIANGPLDTNDEFIYATIASYAQANGTRAAHDVVSNAIEEPSDVEDALAELELGAAEAGYVLGLAVGLALGSGQPFRGAR
jgi:hypothetical protein